MVQYRAIFTMDHQQKVAYGLSNDAIFNDLERPLTWFSRSRKFLTLNISQTATDTAIVIWKANRKPYPSFQTLPLSTTFSDL